MLLKSSVRPPLIFFLPEALKKIKWKYKISLIMMKLTEDHLTSTEQFLEISDHFNVYHSTVIVCQLTSHDTSTT